MEPRIEAAASFNYFFIPIMTFRINDYNAFLTSLYDKTGDNQQDRQKEQFPVDFDFGLGANPPPFPQEEPAPRVPGADRSENMPFLARTGDRSLLNSGSDGDFNPYTVNFMTQDDIYIKQEDFKLENKLDFKLEDYKLDDFKLEDFKQDFKQNIKLAPFEGYKNSTSFRPTFPSDDINSSRNETLVQSSSKLLFKDQYMDDEQEEETSLKESPKPSLGRPRVKSAHNVIEQRYRNKINLKFNVLQNLVPTLRVVARRKQRGGDDEDDEDYVYAYLPGSDSDDLEGLEPARKLNKGTILAKSIEYIKFLELKNERMKLEHDELVLKAKMLGIKIDE